jgi:hypothetical protein
MQNLTMSWQTAGAVAAVALASGAVVRRTGRESVGLVLREIGTVLALFSVWQFAGTLSVMGSEDATGRAQWVWDTERSLGLPSERTLQHWVLPHPWLVQGANYYYATMHFGAVIALLVWLFLRHRQYYPWARMTLVLVTASSLAVQLVPVAPPRLLPAAGMADTAVQYGQSVYGTTIGGVQADAYSAMPSVHVAWCVLVAVAVVRAGRSRWRWLAVLHPVLTVLVVVVTANHFWLDGVAALVLLGASYAVQAGASRIRARVRAPQPREELPEQSPAEVGAER